MSQSSSGMSGQLSSAEMMASEQAAASQAMAEAQSQLAAHGESLCEGGGNGGSSGQGQGQTGQWRAGDASAQSAGSGGAGRGNGGTPGPDAIAQDFVLQREKAKVQTEGGPIIGSTVVYGAQVRGESRATFGAAAEAARAEASEAIETKIVPREYHDSVRAYFGRLEEAAKAERPEEPADGGDG